MTKNLEPAAHGTTNVKKHVNESASVNEESTLGDLQSFNFVFLSILGYTRKRLNRTATACYHSIYPSKASSVQTVSSSCSSPGEGNRDLEQKERLLSN